MDPDPVGSGGGIICSGSIKNDKADKLIKILLIIFRPEDIGMFLL